MDKGSEEKSKVISVTLNARSRAVIEAIRSDTGVPNTEAMARILEWFAAQDRKFRVAILVKDEDAKREFARLALLDLAGMSKDDLPMAAEDLSPDDAAKVAQAMVQRLLIAYRAEVAAGKMERRKGKA